MNILLILPKTPDWLWGFRYALSFIGKKPGYPPLGLLTVAALLPAEWHKRLVDTNVQELKQKDIEWSDFVFISAMSMQGESTRQIIVRCKQAGRKVVAGGPLFIHDWEKYSDVDYFIINEAELILPEFIADLEAGCPRRVYERSEYPDIQRSPVPLWHLLKIQHYELIGVQFSRGCPHDCDFCNISDMLGRKYRTKTATQLITELDGLYAAGWRKDIYFVDDNFIGNIKKLKSEILPALINWRKGKKVGPFLTLASINLADDDELLRLMYEAGFISVFVGIETPDNDSLEECNKYNNKNRNLVESVRRIHRAGIRVQGSFIVGFDNDTPAVFQKQIDFIQSSGIAAAKVNLLNAPYGTKLYKRVLGEGRLNTDITLASEKLESTNIIPKMGLAVLESGYRNLMQHIYSPQPYYERVKNFLREYKKPKIRAPLEAQHISAFFRTVYHIGIMGVERAYYWRLLFWTAFRRPALFPMAITLVVYGYHFRKYCERLRLD
jgi:radical SAM superfamily enzyme YgiQ (UPF0313 family)